MNNDCIFKIPSHICNQLGIEDERDEFKEYMVNSDGQLYLPWNSMFRFNGWCHEGEYDGIMTEASYLLDSLMDTEKKEYQQMITDLINFHENKFDNQKGIA